MALGQWYHIICELVTQWIFTDAQGQGIGGDFRGSWGIARKGCPGALLQLRVGAGGGARILSSIRVTDCVLCSTEERE